MDTTTSADGTRIAYDRLGDGRPVVFVHGTGGTPGQRAPFLPALADEFEVSVHERRGWGPSERADDHSLERHVEDVAAVIDDVDGDPVLFGHSFGGLCALVAAGRTSVDRLILYEPAVLVDDHREATAAAEMDALLDEGNPEAATKLAMREMANVEDVEGMDNWPGIVDQASVIRDEFEVVEGYRLPDAVDVDVPTLVLTGDRSPGHLRDGARAIRDALPDGRLVELDGVGHTGATAPGLVVGEVRSFVDGS